MKVKHFRRALLHYSVNFLLTLPFQAYSSGNNFNVDNRAGRGSGVTLQKAMKKDIESKDDIPLLIDTFYSKVRNNEAIGYIFNDIAKVDWEHHLPIMYSFWEGILFHTGSYARNPMVIHKALHQQHPLSAAHFKEWLRLFKETVDELFEGLNAELIKQRAESIATVMQLKIIV